MAFHLFFKVANVSVLYPTAFDLIDRSLIFLGFH